MDLDLMLVNTFVVLVEERNFRRAADRLNITSSALTKRVQRLERQIGVPLLEHGSSGAHALTGAGSRLATAAPLLLSQAQATRDLVRHGPPRQVLRVGIPAGAGALLNQMNLASIAAKVRASFPEATIVPREVPFSALDRCLSERQVDVLVASDTIDRPEIECFGLDITMKRIALVAANHRLADAAEVHVDELMSEPMLYNPHAPANWMGPFWFADMRSRRDARLVETLSGHHLGVIGQLQRQPVLMGSVALGAKSLPRQIRAIQINDAPPLHIHAARRRRDGREAVEYLVRALRESAPLRL